VADGDPDPRLMAKVAARAGWALSAAYLHIGARPRLGTDDRRVLEERIFPALYKDTAIRRILFVGVSEHTRWYPNVFRTRPGLVFETADPREDAAEFGAGRNHWRERFEDLRGQSSPYDVIVLNGVFEYGTDRPDEKSGSLVAARELLVPGGLLVIGYRDRAPDPDIDLAMVAKAGFEPAPIPGLGTSRHATEHPNGHTYAAFRTP
jgi:hypothetical protein